MKDSKSYVGWEFGTDWKISEDGLYRAGWRIREITSLEVKTTGLPATWEKNRGIGQAFDKWYNLF